MLKLDLPLACRMHAHLLDASLYAKVHKLHVGQPSARYWPPKRRPRQ